MGAFASKKVLHTALKGCTLWKADRSPASRAVMMTLDAMNLSVEEVDVDIDNKEQNCPEIAMINALQTLPVFKDQRLIICESHAICAYLASRHCFNSPLYPADPGFRAIVHQNMLYNCGVLYPRYRAAVDPILNGNEKFLMPQHVNNIECSYVDLEMLLRRGRRDWFGSPWPTLSDITIGATLSTLDRIVPVDPQRFPLLSAWLCRFANQSFYATANEKGLSDFVKKIDCREKNNSEYIKCQRSSERRRHLAITKYKCDT